MNDEQKPFKKIAQGFALSSEVVGCVLVCLGLGYVLEKQFETFKPWLTVILGFLGLIIGCYRLIKSYQKISGE